MELFKILGRVAIDNQEAIRELDETSEKAEQSHSRIADAFGKIGSAAMVVGETIVAGLAAGSVAIGKLVSDSVSAYADYEQLVGGVDTLFKRQSFEEFAAASKDAGMSLAALREEYESMDQAADVVMKNASNAFKTAGLSANEYMETVTSFSASLLQSLEGDTNAAANKADKAITDMADNANKMGTAMESIQNAYQGFAKQNYTMLDNLKLGYGGTKEEMERLLEDAEALSGIEYNIDSYADIVDAIHVVQKEMGITGTTAKEATKTIQGSLAATKSAWQNLLTGMASEEADFETLIDNFVESVGHAAENILPRVEVALEGCGELVDRLFPIIIEKIPAIIQDFLPRIVESAVTIVRSLVSGIQDNHETILETVMEVCGIIASTIAELMPEIVQLGFELVISLVQGIADNIEEIVNSAIGMIDKIVEIMTNEESLVKLIEAALTIVLEVAKGIIEHLPKLVDAACQVIIKLVDYLLSEGNIMKLLAAAGEIIIELAKGLLDSVATLTETAVVLVGAFIDKIFETDWIQVGKDIISGVVKGILDVWSNFVSNHPTIANALTQGFGSMVAGGTGNSLGGLGVYTMMGVSGSHADGLDYVPYDGYIAELHKGEMVVPAETSSWLRSGALGAENGEVVRLLEMILDALEESRRTETSMILNNREFARLVKAVN